MTRTMHVASGYILDGLTAQSKVTFLNGLTRNANRVVLNVTDEGLASRLEMLTHQAGMRLLKTASQKPEWETAYLATVLAVGTTARGCELRGLRWADVNLIDRTVTLASEGKWEIAP